MPRRKRTPRAEKRRYVELARTRPAPEPVLSEATTKVRALYEDTALPVRAIAQAAGVTERTVYNYAAKFGWKPRVVWLARGTGGRFVPREDADQPVLRGIAALDPEAAQRAAERCVAAGLIAQTQADAALAASEAESRLRALDTLTRTLADLGQSRRAVRPETPPEFERLVLRMQNVVISQIADLLERRAEAAASALKREGQ